MIGTDRNGLQDFRCGCGKLLFKGNLARAVVEIKCKRCGGLCTFDEQNRYGRVSVPA